MCFYVSVFPASMLALFGFVTMYVSGKTTGAIQGVSRLLGIWLYVLAFIVIAIGSYINLSGNCTLNEKTPSELDTMRKTIDSEMMDEMSSQMPGSSNEPEYGDYAN